MILKNNNQKKLRKFHLLSLPKRELYLILDKSFREIFFNKLYQLIGRSTTLGKKISVDDETIRRWKLGLRTIPNWALLELNNLLKNKKFSIQEIEENIVAYRGESSKKPITKPKLPIVEDERLIRIVSHLLCDGYDGGKKHLPCYYNTEETLIQNFIKDLTIFGNVPIKLRCQMQGNKPKYSSEFPRIFTHILRGIYKIKFDGDNARLPKYFLNIEPKLAFQIIKSFADDESCVRDSKIRFSLKNKPLVEDFYQLIKTTLGLKPDEITKIKQASYNKDIYYFELNRAAFDKYHKHINFFHPNKKMLLEFAIKRGTKSGNKYPIGEAKKKILNILSERSCSRKELSLLLGIKSKNITFHLKNLIKEGKITFSHKTNYGTQVWRVNQ